MLPRPAGIGAVCLLVFTACDGPAADDPVAEPSRGGTVVLAEAADMTLPTPLTASVVLDGNLADVMFMGLTRGLWEDGRLVHVTSERSPMALAHTVEQVGPDSAQLRFHLRTDVRWSDGEPVAANDVVFTYTLARAPELGFPAQNYLAQIDSVVAENDSTVSFFFARLYPQMLSHAAIGILPEHQFGEVAAADFRRTPAVVDPSGGVLLASGPYVIESWTRDREVTLTPNPHFEPRPLLERIVIRIIPDATTRLVELETGGVDYAATVAPAQAKELVERRPEMRAVREEGRYYDFAAYNAATPYFEDAAVRRALLQAVDVEQVLAALDLEGFATPASGPYSPVFTQLYDEEVAGPIPYDTAAARTALADAGWTDSDGDGVLDRDGRPFRFILETNSESRRRSDLSVLLREYWQRIGVVAELRQSEYGALIGRVQSGDFEAALMGWGVPLSPDLTEMWRAGSPFNFASYSDPRLDSLFALALAQPTEERATPYWRQAAAHLAGEQPFNWLYYFDGVGVVGPRLQGMKVDTFGSYQNVWEWWVE